MKIITDADLVALGQQAQRSPRLRANTNLHQELADPVQRLAIAMEPGTLIPPHRHPQTWELLAALRGRFTVLSFDASGTVTGRALLGDGVAVVETPVGGWHAVLSRDEGAVIFEVKQGPYRPIDEVDIAPWSKRWTAAELTAWYAVAKVGDRIA